MLSFICTADTRKEWADYTEKLLKQYSKIEKMLVRTGGFKYFQLLNYGFEMPPFETVYDQTDYYREEVMSKSFLGYIGDLKVLFVRLKFDESISMDEMKSELVNFMESISPNVNFTNEERVDELGVYKKIADECVPCFYYLPHEKYMEITKAAIRGATKAWRDKYNGFCELFDYLICQSTGNGGKMIYIRFNQTLQQWSKKKKAMIGFHTDKFVGEVRESRVTLHTIEEEDEDTMIQSLNFQKEGRLSGNPVDYNFSRDCKRKSSLKISSPPHRFEEMSTSL